MKADKQQAIKMAKAKKKIVSKWIIATSNTLPALQKVGFRAQVMKKAIQQNLAGYALNHPDGSVHFVYQGKLGRIEKALKALEPGTAKSGPVSINSMHYPLNKSLDFFIVLGWTSHSRNISQPYDLIFHTRPLGNSIKADKTSKFFEKILENTVDAEDLPKVLAEVASDSAAKKASATTQKTAQAAKKPAAKKAAPAKKAAVKKTAATKKATPTSSKAPAQKTPVKKAPAKKVTAKKPVATKVPSKKAPARKPVAKKAPSASPASIITQSGVADTSINAGI